MAAASSGYNLRLGNRYDILSESDPIPSKSKKILKRRNAIEEFSSNSFFQQKKTAAELLNGPKFILMKRQETDNPLLTMRTVSPVVIDKAVKQCAGEVKSIQRSRNDILIETFTKLQAEKLCNMKKLFNLQNVSITEHPFLNTMKGIISSQDFQFMSKEEIEESLKDQYCTEVRKITRKVNNEILPTNSIIATFNLPQLPVRVRVGFLSLNVRTYYPNPLRCFKCQRFGHSSKVCDSDEICGKCSMDGHQNDCTSTVECYNCAENHVSWSKECEIFKQEQAIVKIKVDTKVDYFQARQVYQESYRLVKQKERPADAAKNRRKQLRHTQPRNNPSQTQTHDHAGSPAPTSIRKITASDPINTQKKSAYNTMQPTPLKDVKSTENTTSHETSIASAGQYAPNTAKATQSKVNNDTTDTSKQSTNTLDSSNFTPIEIDLDDAFIEALDATDRNQKNVNTYKF